MRSRFGKQKKPVGRGILLPLLTFAALGVLFLSGLQGVSRTSSAEQLRAVERAVTRAVRQCYAIEGRYPSGLGYLEEHYGLVLDHEKYIIQYDIFASNIMPSVLVLQRDFEEGSGEGLGDETGF